VELADKSEVIDVAPNLQYVKGPIDSDLPSCCHDADLITVIGVQLAPRLCSKIVKCLKPGISSSVCTWFRGDASEHLSGLTTLGFVFLPFKTDSELYIGCTNEIDRHAREKSATIKITATPNEKDVVLTGIPTLSQWLNEKYIAC
jgi:hypothetical protein